jgi:transposase-like protein
MAKPHWKTPRKSPLSDEEKAKAVEMYASGEYSFRDIAEEMDSNPTTIARVVKDAGVPIRNQGSSAIAVRNMKRNNARRREAAKQAAELRLAEEIAAARRQDRINARADEIAAVNPGSGVFASLLEKEARASVALDGETHVVGDSTPVTNYALQEAAPTEECLQFSERVGHGPHEWQMPNPKLLPRGDNGIRWCPGNARDDDYTPEAIDRTEEDRSEVTWSADPDHRHHDAVVASQAIHRMEQLARPLNSFSSVRREGTLVWTKAGDQPEWAGLREDPSVEEMAAEHSAELSRAHEYAKAQWKQGVSYGYDQATKAVLELIDHLFKTGSVPAESVAAAVMEELKDLINEGEHWYRQHKDPKPWQNWEANR